MTRKGRSNKPRQTPRCPECGALAIPVVHGIPSSAQQKAIKAGNAIVSNREEWEGMTEWYCKGCGCDWSGRWRRFKRPGSVNATR